MSDKNKLIALGIDCTPKDSPRPSESPKFKASLQMGHATPASGNLFTIMDGHKPLTDDEIKSLKTLPGSVVPWAEDTQKKRADAWKAIAARLAVRLRRHERAFSDTDRKAIQDFDALSKSEG